MRMSFCVEGAAFGEDQSRVECHLSWQAHFLEHCCVCSCDLKSTDCRVCSEEWRVRSKERAV